MTALETFSYKDGSRLRMVAHDVFTISQTAKTSQRGNHSQFGTMTSKTHLPIFYSQRLLARMRKLNFREARSLAQRHILNAWQSQGLKGRPLDSNYKPFSSIYYRAGLGSGSHRRWALTSDQTKYQFPFNPEVKIIKSTCRARSFSAKRSPR